MNIINTFKKLVNKEIVKKSNSHIPYKKVIVKKKNEIKKLENLSN